MLKKNPCIHNYVFATRAKLAVLRSCLTTALLVPFLATSSASAQECVATDDLLASLSNEQTLLGKPCDAIGRAFVLGLTGKGRHATATDTGWSDQDLYYIYVRFYLADEVEEGGESWDQELFLRSYPFLVAARELLPSFDDSPLRKMAYEIFPTLAFAQYGVVEAHTQRILLQLIFDSFVEPDLNSGRKIHCFIKLDVPTLSESEIIDSEQYQNCLLDR